jgi:hypothetical protein
MAISSVRKPRTALFIMLAFLLVTLENSLFAPVTSVHAAVRQQLPLPAGVSKIAFGTAFNNDSDCEITEPLTAPIAFPTGTTQIAFQVVFAQPGNHSYRASIEPTFGQPVRSRNCNTYTICMGQVCQKQFGATIQLLDGGPLPDNAYTFSVSVDGSVPVEIPFTISTAQPTAITTQPQNLTIVSGQTALLTVDATGSEPLTFQWYQGRRGDVSTPVADATSSTFVTPALTGNTEYWARVSSATAESADSDTAAVTVVTHFAMTVPNDVSAGVEFPITITAKDANDTVATEYTGNIFFTGSDDTADLPASYTFTTADRGQHTFTVTLHSPGAHNIVVQDLSNTAVNATGALTVEEQVVHTQYLPAIIRP